MKLPTYILRKFKKYTILYMKIYKNKRFFSYLENKLKEEGEGGCCGGDSSSLSTSANTSAGFSAMAPEKGVKIVSLTDKKEESSL